MKIIYYILVGGLFFLLANCQRNAFRSISAENEIQPSIIGNWRIYNRGNLLAAARCNSCPKIDLKYDSTGIVYLGQEVDYTFKWTVYGDSINIVVDSAINDRLNLNDTYNYSVIKRTSFTELLLKREIDKNFIKHFLLRRELR